MQNTPAEAFVSLNYVFTPFLKILLPAVLKLKYKAVNLYASVLPMFYEGGENDAFKGFKNCLS